MRKTINHTAKRASPNLFYPKRKSLLHFMDFEADYDHSPSRTTDFQVSIAVAYGFLCSTNEQTQRILDAKNSTERDNAVAKETSVIQDKHFTPVHKNTAMKISTHIVRGANDHSYTTNTIV